MNSFRAKRNRGLQSGMAQLTLSFLGTFQVVLGDDPITKFRSANVQGLLVYLALHPGRALSRDVLAALFWPDEPDSTARTNFRQTLYQLRKLLEEGEDEARPFLIVTRQTIQFNPESDHECDVTAFLRALKRGDLATAVGQPDGLYPDDLLPGFTCDSLEFEDWLRRERERLHGLALDALQQRTDWLLGSGNPVEAKALAQRQLALEPWRELAHRQLMQAYALSGDRQAALAQFEQCQEILWEELAVEPERKTAELAEKIAAGEKLVLQTRSQNNLIAPVTAFFGREADLAAVCARITDRAYRLVTLVGEGGMGKSRLALEVAWRLREQFADGVWFVPLVGLEAKPAGGSVQEQRSGIIPPQVESLQEAIATAVLQTLDQPLAGQQTAKARLIAFLRERNMLLVLDNFEPLLAGAPLVLELLQQAPGVCVICTSREPLNFQAEWVLPLERLPLPPIADPFLNTTAVPQDPTTFPAVQLFVDRAQRANGRFQLTEANVGEVVTLCHLLVGLPLALELAAAALRHQTLGQIIAALQNSIDTLATQRRDIAPRHRSMRAVFESSWALLTPAEQAQLAGLSVFLGPFSVRAAEVVTEATQYELHRMLEKSLLQKQGERFVLHALLREFAAEKLADFAQSETAVVRHSHYYLQAVADLGGALNGEMPHLAVQRIAQAWENVKGAWETAVTRHDFAAILSAVVPLSDFCQIRGFYREGVRLFEMAAEAMRPTRQPEALAQLLTQQAALQVRLSNYARASSIVQEALSLTTDAWVTARLQLTGGEILWRKGDLSTAAEKVRQGLALAQREDFPLLQAIATFHLGVVFDLQGAHEASLATFEDALRLARQINHQRLVGFVLTSIGLVARRLSRPEAAQTALAEALQISQANNDRQGQAMALNNLSALATLGGDFMAAQRYLLQAISLAEAAGGPSAQAPLYHNLGWNGLKAGWLEEAERYTEQALQLHRQIGDKGGEGNALRLLGDILAANGRSTEALTHYQMALALSQQVGDGHNEKLIRQGIDQLNAGDNKKRE
ncbi:MAG: tetratricopeptide repeat protein [Anaerolineaceae bacterium]|nr:tetratricopeptide repeat protein [Anaerolineaceae bacterium]